MAPEADDFEPSLEWPGYGDAPEVMPKAGAVAEEVTDAASEEPGDDDGWDDEVVGAGWDAVSDDDTDVATTMVPLLPAMAHRLEVLGRVTARVSTQLESLVIATGSIRSLLSDQLLEQEQTTSTLQAVQSEAVEEYRRGNERLMADLKGTLTSTERALRDLAARVEELAREGKDVASAVDALAASSAPAPRLAKIEAEPAGARAADRDRRPRKATADGDAASVAGELVALREEMVLLRRRIGVRGRAAAVSLDDANVQTIVESIVAQLDLPTTARLDDGDIGRIVTAVTERFGEIFEIVPDEAAPAPLPSEPSHAAAVDTSASGPEPKRRRSRSSK